MELIKESTVYLNSRKNGASINIPKVFFDFHKLSENRGIEIHSETLPDGRKALVVVPKIQPNSAQTQTQSN